MWEFLRKLFRKPSVKSIKSVINGKSSNPRISQADEIRKYAKTQFIIPARKKGDTRVSFTSKDIHQGMDLQSRYPQVCASIDSKKFKEFARVELIKREGPQQGATARWTFKV
jgi:hypothetical protein